MKDDIPDKWVEAGIIALIVIFGLWFGYVGYVVYTIFSPKQAPEPQIERIGSPLILIDGNSLKASISPNTPYSGAKITRVITGYSSTPDQTDDTPFITASGTRVRRGIVAANEFPIGQKMVIDGILYTVEDRTHPKNYGVIDIWFPTREEAKNWGRQVKTVILLN